MKCLKIHVIGKVQGVWFRASTKKEAENLSVNGTVRNLPDGSVLIYAEGEASNMNKFVDWCKQGPEFANVIDLIIEVVEEQNFQDFKIIRA